MRCAVGRSLMKKPFCLIAPWQSGSPPRLAYNSPQREFFRQVFPRAADTPYLYAFA